MEEEILLAGGTKSKLSILQIGCGAVVYIHAVSILAEGEEEVWHQANILQLGLSLNRPSARVGTRTALLRRKTVAFLRTVCVGISPLAICRS